MRRSCLLSLRRLLPLSCSRRLSSTVRPRGAPRTSPARPASLFSAFQPRFLKSAELRGRGSPLIESARRLLDLADFFVGAVKRRRSEGRAGEVPGAPRGLRPSAGGNRGGGLASTRASPPTSGGAGGDWYTTANSLQFGMLVCSESSVVYPSMEVAMIATWGNARGAAAAASKFVYNRKFAAARCAHLQRIFGCIPCRVGKAAFAWKGAAPPSLRHCPNRT